MIFAIFVTLIFGVLGEATATGVVPLERYEVHADVNSSAAVDDVALGLINSFRLNHQNTPAITYSSSLALVASQCGEARAATIPVDLSFPCTAASVAGYGESINIQVNSNPIDGLRAAIADPDPTAPYPGWFGSYVGRGNAFFSSFDPSTAGYSQMIWASSRSVGCAYSAGTGVIGGVAYHVLTCIWNPPGNTPSTYLGNIFPEFAR